jgi:hypothetical protein
MDFTPRVRDMEKGREIFDPIRKKYVALTPEEWVRQQLVHFLITEQHVPLSLIGVEVTVPFNRRSFRADVVVYGRYGQPLLLAECKAGEVKITSRTFMQIAGYNLTLHVPWLIVSNGVQLYCCMFNAATGQYDFVDKVPTYEEMKKEESRQPAVGSQQSAADTENCILPTENCLLPLPAAPFPVLLFLLLTTLLLACGDGVNVKNVPVEITVQRFDRDLRAAARDTTQIPALRQSYGSFLEYFSAGLIGIGTSRRPEYARLLSDFARSPIVETACRSVEAVFPDEKILNKALTGGFKHLSYYFPDLLIPRIYGYVSGFNEAVMLTDSVVGVGLDRFLGDTCALYDQLDFPKYQQRSRYPARIPVVCLQSWLASEFPESHGEGNFLQQMMYEGKLLYVAGKCFPQAADTLIFGFSKGQMTWCERNEAGIWEYLLENQLLYIENQFTIRKFTDEAPFTSAFTPEAPGRAVNWLAYRIVDKYMKRSKASFPELMRCDAQVILKEARYNP